MSAARWLVLVLALGLAGLCLWRLGADEAGLSIEPLAVGTTPATVYRQAGETGPAPVVVIAHGFAGSRQLMNAWALTLARAGYIAVSFDFEGHGKNPVPMSGDVTKVEGTTRLLMDEVGRVTDAALALPGADGRVALLGHSMASDVVVRQAVRDPRVQAVVAVSMFSEAVTAEAPGNLLVIAGEWEGFLSEEALRALRLADPSAGLGQTLGDPAQGTARRAVLAPKVEHVSVLWSATALGEAQGWLDAAFGRPSGGPVAVRGGWIALLIAATVATAWPLAGLLRRFRADAPPPRLPLRAFLVALGVPALGTPLVLRLFDTSFLPVLVADYLALHFALFGLASLALLALFRGLRGGGAGIALALAVPVAGWAVLVFGGMLETYVASFWPTPGRLVIIAAIAAGAVPFMLADAALTEGGRAPLWRVLAVRGLALGSLGLAVALDFERLFFLVIILPVILLYFLLFGTVAGWVGRATWRPAAAGVALGFFLAWALGVTFPLFAAV